MPLKPETIEELKTAHRCLEVAIERDPSSILRFRDAFDLIRFKAACEDAWYFLTSFVETKNELGVDGEKYRPFPRHDYLRHMLDQWQATDSKPSDKLHLTAKSRQIMASWFACAMVLYCCMTGKAVRVGWQGKKAEDTDEMLKRIYGIWERMPEVVKKKIPCEPRFLHLHFPTTDSDIHAIPQGEAQVRQYTWRYFISDEMAFQEGAEESYYALLPALGKVGMLWIISTAAPGHFEELYKSPPVISTNRVLCKGMETWRAKNGITILRLHWSADPTKDEAWADSEAAKYGGRESSYWRSEYEIDFQARRGGLVFPQFSISTHTIPPFTRDEIKEWPKWRVIDPGYNNFCATGWYTANDGVLFLYRELYLQGKTVAEIAPQIKALSSNEKYEYTLIDPSAFARTLSANGRSIGQLFADNGIICNPAYRASHKRDQIPAAADLITLDERGQPRFKVTNDCENFIREIMGYRWKLARDDQPTPEEPVKIDDHGVDTFLYMAAAVNLKVVGAADKDKFAPWYDGMVPSKIRADTRRMHRAADALFQEQEP